MARKLNYRFTSIGRKSKLFTYHPASGRTTHAHTESSNMTYQKHVKPYQNAVSTGDAIERKEKQERKNIKVVQEAEGFNSM